MGISIYGAPAPALTNIPPVDVTGTAASAGVSVEAARADHLHRGGIRVVADTAARTALTPFDGMVVYQQNDWSYYAWLATQWVKLMMQNDTRIADSGWQAPVYQNGWVDYDATYGPVRYRKIGSIVFIRGLVRSGTAGTAIFTLPAGYRPAIKLLFGVDANANAHGRMDIDSAGQVIHVSGNNGYFQVTCSFVAEL